MTKDDQLRQAVLDRLKTFPTAKAYADHIGCDVAVVSRFQHANPAAPTRRMLADLVGWLLTKDQQPAKSVATKGTSK